MNNMNKIIIVNDEITEKDLDNSISVTYSGNEFLSEIKIDILSDTDLTINYISTEETKLHLCFNILEGVKCNLFEIKNGLKH